MMSAFSFSAASELRAATARRAAAKRRERMRAASRAFAGAAREIAHRLKPEAFARPKPDPRAGCSARTGLSLIMNNETALITGASSGIGLHLAHEFARHGHPVVLVAPVEAELRAVAAHMKTQHGVEARVIAKDLAQTQAAREIFDELQAARIQIDILVNNAGHGFHGPWWEQPLEQDLSMLRLNIEAVLRLTKLFLPPMVRRGRG